jgi:RHS repeat-associated protein
MAGMPARGEVVSLRNRTSRSFATSPGQFRVVYYSRPINFRTRGGAWKPINDRVVPSARAGYAFQNAANSYTAFFPADLGTNPILIKRASGWVSFGLVGARGPPRVSGSTVSYRDALPGVTLRYRVMSDRVVERIVLASPRAAAESLRYSVASGDGLSLHGNGRGIDVDAHGKTAFQFVAPSMRDAAGRSPSRRAAPALVLAGSNIRLSEPRRWLRARARRWPVVIDPTTVTSVVDTRDCELDESAPNTGGCSSGHDLLVGFTTSNSKARRSVLQFDVSDLLTGGAFANLALEDATLKLYCESGTTGNTATLSVRRLTTAFGSGASWNTYDNDPAHTWTGGDFPTTDYGDRTGSNCSSTGYKTWPVDGSGGASDLITYWRTHSSSNDGLLVKEASETVNNVMDFDPDTGTHPPQLVVDVYNAPSDPAGFGGSLSWVDTSLVRVTASSTADSGRTIAGYNYETSSDGTTWSSPAATTFAAGAWGIGISSEGQTYVRFQAVDDLGDTSNFAPAAGTAGATVRIDRSPPTAPTTVSGGSASWTNSAVTFTASGATDAGAGVDHYIYRLSQDNGGSWSGPTTGGSVTVSTSGVWLVQFAAVDSIGGSSHTSTYYPASGFPTDPSTAKIDTTAPSAPFVSGGSLSWQNVSSASVAASGSTDTGFTSSGVDHYQYRESTDGGSTWSSPTNDDVDHVVTEGETLVQLRAVDAAGNTSTWAPSSNGASNTIRIDRTNPTAPTSVTGGSLSWQSVSSATITASGGSDALDLDHYDYETSTNGGSTWSSPSAATNAGSGNWTTSVSAEAETVVRFRAVDGAGNASGWVPSSNGAGNTARIDRTNPTAPSLSGASGSWQQTDSVAVSASGSTDAGSGVDHYESEVSTDGGSTWSTAASGASAAVTDEGVTDVRFRSVDAAGNVSSWTSGTVEIDRTPPNAPLVTGGSDTWQSTSSITVSASGSTDSLGAGFDHYEYETSTDGGDTWSSASSASSHAVTGEGQTLVRFRAVDAVANKSAWTSTTVRIDRTAPATPTVTGGSLSVQDVESVVISATTTDTGGAGVDYYQYETSTDGGSTWSSPTTGDSATIADEGTTLVRFDATDQAGNTSGWGPTTNGADNTVDIDRSGSGGSSPPSTTISTNTTWGTGDSPVTISDATFVASGVTLTIDAGVTVEFTSSGSLTVNGTLNAGTTGGSDVTFTSASGDTPGAWNGLSISGSTATGTLLHTLFEFGASGSSSGNSMLSATDGGDLVLTDSTLKDAGQTGLAVSGDGTAEVTRTKITDNGAYGVLVNDGVLTMTDSAVWKSGSDGVRFQLNSSAPSTRSTISGTSIWWNAGTGVQTLITGGAPTPSGTGNNIYDSGTWTPSSSPLQLATNEDTNPDWTGDYWGPVTIIGCGGLQHLAYPVILPAETNNIEAGPVDWTGHSVGAGVCPADNVPDVDPAFHQLDLYFPTPPATFGGLLLQELFGCPECMRQYQQMIHAHSGDPNSPASHAPDPEQYTGDPVNVATGTLTETNDDVHLNGPGTSFDWLRTYNSRDTTSGLLGVGWSTTYDTGLSFPDGSTVVYRAGDGQQTTYVLASSKWVTRGNAAKLAKIDDGGGHYHWTLTSTDQRVMTFNEDGQLTQIAPRFTAPTTLSYNGGGQLTDITDAAGRDITLGYTGGGLVDSVTLPDSREVTYSYTSDKLTGMTNLRGEDWTIGYDGNGYLNSIQDPNGHYPLRATYDATGRVVSEKNANGDRTTYAYTTTDNYDVTTVDAPGRGPVVYDFRQNLLAQKTDSLGNTTSYSYDLQHNVASITDPRGNTTNYTYDPSGDLVKQTAPSPLNYTQEWAYNATGEVTSYTDGRGHTTSYDYAGSGDTGYQVGELKTITDPDTNTTTYTYYQPGASAAKVGLAHTVQDARGKTTTYDYDSDGNLASATSDLGNETTMTYDASGRVETRVDPRGNATGGTPSDYTTTWTYNDANQVASVTNARNHTTTYSYDPAGNLLAMRTPDGLTSYGYDDANQLTSIEDPRGHTEDRTYEPGGHLASTTSPQGSRTTYGYDSAGELTSMVTPRGHETGATPSDYTWTYTYDEDGDQVTATHPDAGTSTITYDALDRPTDWEDPLTHTTSVTYDGDGNVAQRIQDMGEHWDYTYDGENRVLTATDPRSKTTTYQYEPTGQLLSTTTAAGNETSYAYDDDERLETMVTPRGNLTGATPADYTWTYGYDPAGNQTTIQDPDGNPETVKTYDADNNLTSVQTPRGNTTSYTYDKMDRLKTVVAPGSGSPTTSYDYNANGDLKTRQTPNGGTTSWTYDADGNPLTMTTPVGEWQTSYNADDTPDVVTAPSADTTTYAYDRMGRTTGIDYSDATPDVSYSYDDAGRMMTLTDSLGTETYTYDHDNRLTKADRGSGDEFDYAYADGLNLTGETYPDGTTISNDYTDDELLHTTTANSKTTTFDYTPDDQLQTTTYPPSVGTTETRGYDHDGNLTSVANTTGSGTLSEFDWTLDSDGNPTQIDTTRGATTTHEALAYDERDRLTKACYTVTTCAGATNTISYSYDPDSNVLQQVRAGSVPNTGTTNYTYNTADQLTGSNNGSATSYSYDDNGNLATAGSDSYTYNLADQLASTTQGATTTDYSYDGMGDRVESDTSGGADTKYRWDRIGPLPQIATERDGGGTLLRNYLYGPQGAISQTSPGPSTIYLYRDPLGSITDTTSSTGTQEWEYSYDPYGNPITATDHASSSPTTPLRYAAQYLDPETSQYQMRAREYDPNTLRFDSQDPQAPPLAQTYAGAYVYANANPALFIDPTGEISVRDVAEGIASNAFQTFTGSPVPPRQIPGLAGGIVHEATDTGVNLYEDVRYRVENHCLASIPTSMSCERYNVNQIEGSVTGPAGIAWNCVWNSDADACGRGAFLAATAAGAGELCGLASTADSEGIVVTVGGSGAPKSPLRFEPPTNEPQLPPTEVPPGWRVRSMPPNSTYPHGYWKLEKPMTNGGWQPIDPSTMKPGTHPETHVPYPAGNR